ncbi:MAG TPA: MFS transporter [Streptosporangiaceae bacterium]|nr:MFS transporter [Streptosporangiaceae bacterium]
MHARAPGRGISALARKVPVLAIRDFRLLLADRILAPASFAFSIVGVSFAVLNETHGSTTILSYVLAAQIAPSIVFVLLGGVVADRIAPQKVIAAGNLMMALGEGTFGVLVLAGHPAVWQMIGLECLTGTGMAIFYPASTALLPRIVPADSMQQASAISRLAMNGAQMSGSVLAGFCVAAIGPGWALSICGTGLLGTLPLILSLRVGPHERGHDTSMLRDLREGWSEFRSHTWIWVITSQYAVVMMAWYGAFTVLGPVVARSHLGGPAAWGAITGTEALGLIIGGLVSLRFAPRRPARFVVLIGASVAVSPLALATLLPLPLICLTSLALGIALEMMMVQWTVAMARAVAPGMLARVAAYDAMGTFLAMPAGAVLAGPIAAAIGVSQTQAGAAGLILVASLLALIPRDIWRLRAAPPGPAVPSELIPVPEAVTR